METAFKSLVDCFKDSTDYESTMSPLLEVSTHELAYKDATSQARNRPRSRRRCCTQLVFEMR